MTEQDSQALLIQDEALTVKFFGTIWASKAVPAGSANPRAMPAKIC